MKIAEINIVPHGSTGRIMLQLADAARRSNHIVETFSPTLFSKRKLLKRKSNSYPEGHKEFGFSLENAIHRSLGTLMGKDGVFSIFSTRHLIRRLDNFNPDIIHLHNLHGFSINLKLLFQYINKKNIKIVWTLHDCWSFTGHCPHFTMVKCERWKTECYKCPQPKVYPKMYLDSSNAMFKLKKKYFCSVHDMIIVTPSEWLGNLVEQSFMNKYPLKVINNGIDLDIFKPSVSDFRNRLEIKAKYIILGVSMAWGKRKGLDVMIELASRLDSRYQVVLVGTTESIDKEIPSNIITIHRTNSQAQLAEIYSAADVFANPTREENFPTVNIESLACGTPVITFNTGGSPEILDDTCGSVVECDDIDTFEQNIINTCLNRPYSRENCVRRASMFGKNDKFREYVQLYDNILNLPRGEYRYNLNISAFIMMLISLSIICSLLYTNNRRFTEVQV